MNSTLSSANERIGLEDVVLGEGGIRGVAALSLLEEQTL